MDESEYTDLRCGQRQLYKKQKQPVGSGVVATLKVATVLNSVAWPHNTIKIHREG